MKTTKIKVVDLDEVLQANRKKHKEEYDKAYKEWKKRCIKALRKALKKAESDEKVIDLYLFQDLPRPQHYLKQYDAVIRRLDLEVEETVELEEQEFQAWVLDNWSWHGAFVGTTSMYNAR